MERTTTTSAAESGVDPVTDGGTRPEATETILPLGYALIRAPYRGEFSETKMTCYRDIEDAWRAAVAAAEEHTGAHEHYRPERLELLRLHAAAGNWERAAHLSLLLAINDRESDELRLIVPLLSGGAPLPIEEALGALQEALPENEWD